VSRTYRILLAAVVALGAVGGYWKLVLSPKRERIAQLDEQIASGEAQLAQTQGLIATYAGARDAYKANYDTVVRLGKAVPNDDDTRSLVVQLDAAAKRAGVEFDTVTINAAGGSGDAATDTPLAPGAISAGAFSAMPFSLTFTGQFSTLGDFLSRLERFVTVRGDQVSVNGRLLRVESIQLQPGDKGWPGLSAQIGASSYIVPETADPATGSGAGANSSVAGSTSSSGTTGAATTTSTTTTANDAR
jgi:Tfp pilus assembly protein PilO